MENGGTVLMGNTCAGRDRLLSQGFCMEHEIVLAGKQTGATLSVPLRYAKQKAEELLELVRIPNFERI